jgi:predicted site-specific integrase-resolvase
MIDEQETAVVLYARVSTKKQANVETIAIAEKEPEDAQSELVRDLLAIVTSFSARLYGAKGGKKVRQGFRELITGVSQDEEAEKEENS